MICENQSTRRVHEASGSAAALPRTALQSKCNVRSAHGRKADPEASENGMTLVEMAVTLPACSHFSSVLWS